MMQTDEAEYSTTAHFILWIIYLSESEEIQYNQKFLNEWIWVALV